MGVSYNKSINFNFIMKLRMILAMIPLVALPVAAQQYYPPSFYSSNQGPVVVPPTIINAQAQEHNSSKKSCRESVIDLFLFSVRRTTGDCTP
jgi:hypothetical protein